MSVTADFLFVLMHLLHAQTHAQLEDIAANKDFVRKAFLFLRRALRVTTRTEVERMKFAFKTLEL